jgi:hypothetical protein
VGQQTEQEVSYQDGVDMCGHGGQTACNWRGHDGQPRKQARQTEVQQGLETQVVRVR